MNKRNLNLKKYGISRKRYKELCGFCEQYPEWKKAICGMDISLKSPEITDMPIYHSNSDTTANLAVKRAEISRKIDLVENTARQASPDMYKYIIKAVCYEVPVEYLIACEDMPISRATFYDLRRYFFYLLDRNKTA